MNYCGHRIKIMPIDPVTLSQALIRCPSVTPEDAGALGVLESALGKMGFECQRLPFSEKGTAEVQNLYAAYGDGSPNLCFAGHTDVVPAGDEKAWTVNPFAAEIRNDMLIGRGAADMKTAIAAWIAAVSRFLESEERPRDPFKGRLSLLITGDEEGVSINGTRKALAWLQTHGEVLDACIVGEPTNPATLGEMIKIGRRGSISFHLVVKGVQGHVAYPDQADNPITKLVQILARLKAEPLDQGTEHFQPSNLEITNLQVSNAADNVIPAYAAARFNIRFNDRHTQKSLVQWVCRECEIVTKHFTLEHYGSGEAFVTHPGFLSSLVMGAVKEVTGKTPALSTTGGTSDARFIKDVCPVVEFGLVGATAHKVDEQVSTADIEVLTHIYECIIRRYFASLLSRNTSKI